MRLSRSRVVLRVALLAVGGAFMLWRAWEARRAAYGPGGPPSALASRLALVWGLVGALALLTAAGAALALRRRPPRHTLRLDDVPRDPPEPPPGSRHDQ